MTATMLAEIAFDYDATGEVLCRNPKGMTFFLFAEPFNPKSANAATPSIPAPAWRQVEATREVEVRRAAEALPIAELAREVAQVPTASFKPVEATREVEVRRTVPAAAPETPVAQPQPAARGTGKLPDVPLPGQQPQKGWFNKLFTRA